MHLNERTPEVRAASDGATPCVLAHTDAGLLVLLAPADLDGHVSGFASALRGAAEQAGLHYACSVCCSLWSVTP